MNLKYVVAAEIKLPIIELILCEAVGDCDLDVADSDIIGSAPFAVDEVHHTAVCANALNRDIAESSTVLCIESEGSVGINCRNTRDVNVLYISAAILTVRGAEFKRAKASLNCDIRYLDVTDISCTNADTESIASCVYHAVGYCNILGISVLVFKLGFIATNSDAVVRTSNNAIRDCDVAARININFVGVKYMDWRIDLDTARLNEVATVEEYCPTGRITYSDIVNGNSAAFDKDDNLTGTELFRVLADRHTASPS